MWRLSSIAVALLSTWCAEVVSSAKETSIGALLMIICVVEDDAGPELMAILALRCTCRVLDFYGSQSCLHQVVPHSPANCQVFNPVIPSVKKSFARMKSVGVLTFG